MADEHSFTPRQHPPGRRLQDRFALVTGAGRGFGTHIALGLAGEGAHVAVHYRSSAEGAERTAAEVRALGREAITVRADLTSWDEIRRMTREVFAAFGRLDVLVNNTGDVAHEQLSWRELAEPLLDRVLAVDVKGTLLTTHEVGGRMLEQREGAIVNVCSNVVVTGSPRAPQYAASKYGVIGVTKSYAHAFAPDVRVNALGPGFIETERTLSRADWTPERRAELVARTPLRRIPPPAQLVPVVLFLASDDSCHMTGNFVLCDGGFSMVGA